MSGIYDKTLAQKWLRIKRRLSTQYTAYEANGMLSIPTNQQMIYIAKNSEKMRLKSHLDWVHYEPKSLAYAIDNNIVDSYYELMLSHSLSDPNQWKDFDYEMELKSFYASRVGRASLI
jgi:hypothetical protein